MSPRCLPTPGILTGLALALLTALPVQAQTAPERVLERSDLLPHLETIRRQYPRLYDWLRREIPPDRLQQALAPSAPSAASTSARAIPIDPLLRQEVRNRSPQAASTTAAGENR
jgi:hypothetical protein